LVSSKVVVVDAMTARQACAEALATEPAAKFASVLDGKGGRHALARFSREELKQETLTPQVEGCAVTIAGVAVLNCLSGQHAAQVARAIACGAVSISIL
jgi:hypothetical protein